MDQRRRSLPTSHTLTLADVNQERTVYLVEVEDEEELNGWYTDPGLWPRDRSLKMLRQWCSFELHTVVVDMGASSLEDDEFEE